METKRIGRNESCYCGSGRKFKQCCYRRERISSSLLQAEGSSLRPVWREPPSLRTYVEYSFSDTLCTSEVWYQYEQDQLFWLTDGRIVSTSQLCRNMEFHLEGGAIAKIKHVGKPEIWGPPSPAIDADGDYTRRLLGKIKTTGLIPLLDVTFGNIVCTSTPGHPFYSASRRGWYPINSFKVGELLLSKERKVIPVQAITAIRWETTSVYNAEVEQHHTYFVGNGEDSAWAHNGLNGGCIPKPANRPAAKNLEFDWTHITERHLPGGIYTNGRTVFEGLNRNQVQGLILDAYGNAKLLATQRPISTGETRLLLQGNATVRGTLQSWTVQMRVNITTNLIETAYPVFPG